MLNLPSHYLVLLLLLCTLQLSYFSFPNLSSSLEFLCPHALQLHLLSDRGGLCSHLYDSQC